MKEQDSDKEYQTNDPKRFQQQPRKRKNNVVAWLKRKKIRSRLIPSPFKPISPLPPLQTPTTRPPQPEIVPVGKCPSWENYSINISENAFEKTLVKTTFTKKIGHICVYHAFNDLLSKSICIKNSTQYILILMVDDFANRCTQELWEMFVYGRVGFRAMGGWVRNAWLGVSFLCIRCNFDCTATNDALFVRF